MSIPMPKTRAIVFFDGVCGLCNRSIDFLIRQDRKRVLSFAPLQGQTAKRLLTDKQIDPSKLNSIYLYIESDIESDGRGKLYSKTDAWIRIMVLLGGPWKVFKAMRILPLFFWNLFYDLVAKTRYPIFGKLDVCRLPGSEEREFFLD